MGRDARECRARMKRESPCAVQAGSNEHEVVEATQA